MPGTKAYLTNFPQGFQTDLGLRNIPVIATGSGRNVWVDSNGAGTGSNAQRRGTYQRPYSTVKLALANAQAYDTIWVKQGHTETIAAAGGWAMSVAGVDIIGVGKGDERPQITFSAVASSALITAAGCGIQNIIGISGAANSNPFNVQAAGAVLGIEWRDVTATTAEAVRVILTNASANNCFFDLLHKGLGGGAVSVNSIRLVGGSGTRINVDFYGNASTSVVEFLTTAVKNVYVGGQSNNAASTNGTTKVVTDTVTGSTWGCSVMLLNKGTSAALFNSGAIAA